jgi:hypothetical protein
VRGCMKASGNSAATVFEHPAVASPEMTMIGDGQAPRNVSAVIKQNSPAAPRLSVLSWVFNGFGAETRLRWQLCG